MDGRRGAERPASRAEWLIPGGDLLAGGAELARLQHAALPALRWGRRTSGGLVLGPAPPPRPLADDLTDAEHAAFLVRLAGLLAFLGAHGLGVSPEGSGRIGARPGSREVPWLPSAPVPAWRAAPAYAVLGATVLRLAGQEPLRSRRGEVRHALEEAASDGLPARSAEALAAIVRSADAGRPADLLLLDLARTGEVGERVSLDLLGLAAPIAFARGAGDRLVASGEAAEWVARGAARRDAGENVFAEAGPPATLEEGAALLALAEALDPDPRAAALRALARGERAPRAEGPPLALLARDLDLWDEASRRAWEELPRALGPVVRIETRAEPPPPWQSLALLEPRLGREDVSGLVHLPLGSPSAFSRLWEELAGEAAGEPDRLLRSARRRARALLPGLPRAAAPRRPPPAGERVLRAAALLGDGFAAGEAAAAAAVDPGRAREALEEAREDGVLVRASRETFRFADEGVRSRLLGALSTTEKEAALARLAERGAVPLRLLLARLGSGEDPTAPADARGIFARLVSSGEFAEAAALLARAPAAEPDLGAPLLALEVWAAAGRMDRTRASAGRLEPLAALSAPLARREAAARVLARIGEADRALALLPGGDDADELLARAGLLLKLRREMEADQLLADLAPGAGPRAARVHLLRAELLERRQRLAEAEAELAAAGTELENASGRPGLFDERFAAGYVALGLRRPREARAFFRAARDEAPDASRRADALFDLSVASAACGELVEAEAALEEALSLFSAAGERERYLGALGQRAALALRRSDARSARRDLGTVLAHDRRPGRAFELLFSVPVRQRLALADGDDTDGEEAFVEALGPLGAHPDHPARREILVLEGARLLAAGRPAEALRRLRDAEPLPDARSDVEPLRARLAASAARDLDGAPPVPGGLDTTERYLLAAEERLARRLAPPAAAVQGLAEKLERPEGPIEVASRLLEWRGRFPAAFAAASASPLRELGLRAARLAGLEGARALFSAGPAGPPEPRETPAATDVAAASFVAEDAATREVFETARRVAASRLAVLVLGESGTGKEVIAREIHRASGRRGPFVAVNVATLPEALAEAELFGAARGAYTGADRERTGVIEASSGGTLFLDEIGDLSPQVQAKLLRVLQEREIRRVGETRTRSVDLRIVSATHRDLAALAAEGRFRQDLLYRIAGITLVLPPLRERPRDLRLLLERALAGAAVSPEARSALLSWSWPGNVRELLSALEAARAMAGGGRIEREHLPPPLRQAPVPPEAAGSRYRAAVDGAKKRVILEALAETGGNRTRAAALLGLSRQSLLYELKRLGIRG